MATPIQRGDVYLADLDPVTGSEQGGCRPVLVIQNDVGNRNSPTLIVAAITTAVTKTLPTHVYLPAGLHGITKESVVLLEQVRTIDKRRLRQHLTRLGKAEMRRVDHALRVSLGL